MAERLIVPGGNAPFPKTRVKGIRPRPHEDLYHFILTLPWWRFLVLLILAFMLVNTFFALLYHAAPGCIAHVHDFEDEFFFSVQTLSTIGYGDMAPATHYGNLIVAIEAFTGMLAIAVVTGLTFAKFSRPTARVLFADKAVVHERDGQPHLVFRLANQRHNLVVEAQLRVILLLLHKTKEGEEMRRAVELPLVRDRTALFALTWIPMHKIDETSPFHGEDAIEKLKKQRAEMFLSLQGYDEALAQTVHSRWRYSIDDIVWDARFEDVLTVDEDGTRNIDYEKFNVILPMKKKKD